MASDKFLTILSALVLFSLFSYLMITAITSLNSEYDKSVDELGGGVLDSSTYKSSIEDVNSSAESYRQRFEQGDVENTDDATGVFSIITDLVDMIKAPFTLLGSVANALGIPSIVISVGLGILAISLILAIWSLIKKGD